jgi:hypothetical protein
MAGTGADVDAGAFREMSIPFDLKDLASQAIVMLLTVAPCALAADNCSCVICTPAIPGGRQITAPA